MLRANAYEYVLAMPAIPGVSSCSLVIISLLEARMGQLVKVGENRLSVFADGSRGPFAPKERVSGAANVASGHISL